MFILKKGVRTHGLKGEMIPAMIAANEAFRNQGKDCIVTSAIDGKHSRSSKHYTGCAIDLRTRHLIDNQAPDIVAELKACLGADYDVVLEGDHIHLEYDPKEPY